MSDSLICIEQLTFTFSAVRALTAALYARARPRQSRNFAATPPIRRARRAGKNRRKPRGCGAGARTAPTNSFKAFGRMLYRRT
jgi:hypothetical protein